jgi:hypothetical protein
MRWPSSPRPWIRSVLALALQAVALAVGAPFSCGGNKLLLCGQIPDGGCPAGRGGTCQDLTCAGLYDCVEGAWTLLKACPGGTGTESDGGPDPSDAGPGDCEKVVIDHTGELDACGPDLLSPDCPAAAAETCVFSACLTECIDFYLCTEGGWDLVAYCNEEGELVLIP